MRFLLLGSNGQVGWELQRSLAPLGEVVALDREERNGLCGDLTQLESLAETVRRAEPDVIVNAAAYTAVDKAESEPELARIINADAPGVLAREAAKSGAWLVHYSTDYVFDGSGDTPWQEMDATGPLNVYGATKLDGEEAIRTSGCSHLIFRTSWVHGAHGANFIRTMLRLGQEKDALKVIDDQIGAPTGAELIADVTAHAVPMARQFPELVGTYHLAAAGQTSWYGYARFIMSRAREIGWPIRVAQHAIDPVASDAFPTAARRPHNSRLDCHALERSFGLRMPPWEQGVERVLEEIDLRLGNATKEHH